MRRSKKEGMQPATLPAEDMTLHAIIYNAGDADNISMRAFEDEQAAWQYGRIMGIEPMALVVKKAGIVGKTNLKVVK